MSSNHLVRKDFGASMPSNHPTLRPPAAQEQATSYIGSASTSNQLYRLGCHRWIVGHSSFIRASFGASMLAASTYDSGFLGPLGLSCWPPGAPQARPRGVLGASWWPTWLQLGSQNGAKIDEKSKQQTIKIFSCLIGLDFWAILMDLGSNMEACWPPKSHQKSTLS